MPEDYTNNIDSNSDYILTCDNNENDEVISLVVDSEFGTYNHDSLNNRDLPEQHPIEAITGLEDKLQELTDNKVDKEDGKSLVDNTLIDTISGINFDEYVIDPNYVHTDNNFSSTYKDKLQGIEPNAQVNTVYSVNSKVGDIVISKDDIGLSNVDNTSDNNKPISRATQNALNLKANKDDLATVATTGEYNDLNGLPTSVSQFNNDLGYITKDSKDTLSNKTLNALNNTITNIGFNNLNTDLISNEISANPSITKLVTEKAVKDIVDTKFDSVNISKVGKTGLYSDLINKPDLTQYATNNAIEIINNQINQLVKPTDLSAVAFSGKYNDLSGKPTIPTKMSQLEQDIEIVDPTLLNSFANKDEVNLALNNKQDKLTAGNHVEITKENIINVDIPVDVIPDETTIIKDEADIITAIGVKTKSNTIKYDWEGTLEEWEFGRREGYIPDNWYCNITDDSETTIVGPKGDAGTIEIGSVVSGDEVSVTNVGTESSAILNFVLKQGEIGPSNILSIGSVESGDTASATIIGDSPNQTLNLVLPKGDTGEISIGEVTKGDEASVTNVGTTTDAILDFVLPKGDKGDKGEQGLAGTITINDVVTVDPNIQASVDNIGTKENAELVFYIPQGVQGIQGEVGPQGIQGETGPSNVLSIGSVTKGDDAYASITGTSPNQVLNLILPKGDKGDQGIQGKVGPQGIQGEAGPSNVLSIGSVESGETPSVTISGSSPSQILNFVLPKGDKGDKGDTGDSGMPIGGTTGQILSKASNEDYDVEWIDNNPSTIDYNELINKPTNVSTFNNDVGYLTLSTLPTWDGGNV